MAAVLPPDASPTPAPAVCPFCQSGQVSTTSKSADIDAYWRCGGCGQIWNPSRLVPPRYGWTR
jgi:transposase-like protein